jgi:hypothetical protein
MKPFVAHDTLTVSAKTAAMRRPSELISFVDFLVDEAQYTAFFAHGLLFLTPPAEIAAQMNLQLLVMATYVGYMRYRVLPIGARAA